VSLQDYFYNLVDSACGLIDGSEVLLLNLEGESSDFVRFNRSAVRQAGHVDQAYLSLELIRGQRHATVATALEQELEADMRRLKHLLGRLRGTLAHAPEDPFMSYATEVRSTEQSGGGALPDREVIFEAVMRAGRGRDMVGLLARGDIFAGFGNSLGQKNWYSSSSFSISWSFYHSGDKAVKAVYADTLWSEEVFERKVQEAAEKLAVLAVPPKSLKPGKYRVYLAPTALRGILDLLCWDGFSLRAHRTKTTPFLRMIEGEGRLAQSVTLRENARDGIAPNFQEQGFLRPDQVDLIVEGRYKECLVSPRSGKQYGVPPNGAGASEVPLSLDMEGGSLPADRIYSELGTGLHIGHTWYLNYSDRPGGRVTGMTRFATFWVERGRIEAPVEVMRFDESIYRFLGEKLVGLTEQRELLPDESTYGARSCATMRLPGILVEDFTFTL